MTATTNKLGHRIGARGGRTRRALMDGVLALLETRHLGEIKVADAAQAAGVSTSNFYTYFSTVEEAVLALCEDVGGEFQPLSRHLDQAWAPEEAFGSARALVLDMLDLWTRHGPVLRVEHMLADKGVEAFAESRIRRLRRLHLSLERRIAHARANGYLPEALNPRLASYEVASLIESVGAGFNLMRRADTPEAIVETTAHIVARLVTGR